MSHSSGPVICFIDDDPVEVDVFKKVFAENSLLLPRPNFHLC